MGTHALIHIKENGKTLVTIYRQYDGYLSGLGLEIQSLLTGSKIVNGYGMGDAIPETFNSMGCLAAYLISKLKTKIGNVYIYPIDSKNCGEEFTYTLYEFDSVPYVKAEAYGKLLFDAPLSQCDMTDKQEEN